MVDMEKVFIAVDHMTPQELDKLGDYIEARKKVTWWIVPPENLEKIKEILRPVHEDAATMSEEEINAVIDEAIAEVRSERKLRKSRT